MPSGAASAAFANGTAGRRTDVAAHPETIPANTNIIEAHDKWNHSLDGICNADRSTWCATAFVQAIGMPQLPMNKIRLRLIG